MKIEQDLRQFGYDIILYKLEKEDKELFNTNFKYFISNGCFGGFGNNKRHLVHTIMTIEGKL